MREESDILTEWFVHSSNPDDIEISDKCKMTSDNGDGVAKISCQGNSMLSENIRSFIDAGGHITELATIWNQELSLTLNTQLQFKGVKFLEIESVANKDESSDESDLILVANTFADLLKSRDNWLAEYKAITNS
jgi:recombination associated protein RdgC